MKKHIALAVLLAAGTLTGCATNSELAEVRAIAEKAQASADQAQQSANSAKAAADQAAAKAASAEEAANQANEQIDRMFKKTMMK